MDDSVLTLTKDIEDFILTLNVAKDSSSRRELEDYLETKAIQKELDTTEGWFA